VLTALASATAEFQRLAEKMRERRAERAAPWHCKEKLLPNYQGEEIEAIRDFSDLKECKDACVQNIDKGCQALAWDTVARHCYLKRNLGVKSLSDTVDKEWIASENFHFCWRESAGGFLESEH
jgi:hypothetical protein